MRESPADKLRALAWSLAFHALAVLVMIGGLWWTRVTAPLSVAGDPIEAVLVADAGALPPRPAQARADPVPAAPPPQPRPEPRPQRAETPPQPTPQEPPPRPDTREQERAALALQQAEERAKREQAERRRQEQIDLTERQKQQEEAEQRERRRQQAEARERELADIRRQREDAERQARLEQQKLEQLRDRQGAPTQTPSPTQAPARAGTGGTDESLAGLYQAAITQAVLSNWIRPETVPPRVWCRVSIIQIPGGEVIDVRVDSSCPYDELGRRSVEAAILKAQPLPYAGFESVFQRDLPFNFCHPPEECRR